MNTMTRVGQETQTLGDIWTKAMMYSWGAGQGRPPMMYSRGGRTRAPKSTRRIGGPHGGRAHVHLYLTTTVETFGKIWVEGKCVLSLMEYRMYPESLLKDVSRRFQLPLQRAYR